LSLLAGVYYYFFEIQMKKEENQRRREIHQREMGQEIPLDLETRFCSGRGELMDFLS
jgi:hypothetical protein